MGTKKTYLVVTDDEYEIPLGEFVGADQVANYFGVKVETFRKMLCTNTWHKGIKAIVKNPPKMSKSKRLALKKLKQAEYQKCYYQQHRQDRSKYFRERNLINQEHNKHIMMERRDMAQELYPRLIVNIDVDATSENIRKHMKKHNFTLEQVSSMVGVTPQAVCKWRVGSSLPNLDNMIVLMRLFKCKFEDLVVIRE